MSRLLDERFASAEAPSPNLVQALLAEATSAGPMFNIYHVSPHETQNPDEFVAEVCFPVREA